MEIPENKTIVGIADMKLVQNSGMLITYALGSCIGVCLYDPGIHLAALLHVLLPINMETGRKSPLKYGDTGIVETLHQMEVKGARRSRIGAKIAGGAKMFEVSANGGGLGNIGQRNAESVRLILRREGIRLLAEDLGGESARTLLFDAATGRGYIRSYGKPEICF